MTALEQAGYAVDTALDGEEGQFLGETEPYDAIILDLGLPKVDGVSRAERPGAARAQDAGASSSPRATAGATRSQASMPAPTTTSPSPSTWRSFWPASRALLRRSAGHADARDRSAVRCSLDTRAGRVAVDGNPVKLTSHEYRLLSYLDAPLRAASCRAGELTEHLYDQDFDRDSNTIEVFIGRLRKKLGVDIIQTVRGLGYLLDAGQAKT